MVFDGLGADLQDFSDAFGVLAFGNQLENLALPARQLFERAFPVGDPIQRKFFEESRGDFPAEINFPVKHPLQGGFQFGRRRFLEQVAGRARLQRAPIILLVVVHGKNDDPHVRKFPGDALRRFQAIEARHGDIHQNHIWPLCLDQIQHLAPIAGFAHHFHPWQLFQQSADAGAHKRVVVGQQDTDGFDGTVHMAPIKTTGCAHFNGNQAWTSVPCLGMDVNSSPPPANAARSSMLNRPRLAPRTAFSRTATTSNPIPSSRTRRWSCPSSLRNSTVTTFAWAWRTTFVNAPCATRKHSVSITGSKRCSSRSAWNSACSPIRAACRSVYQRKAGSNPRSSRIDGRKFSEMSCTCSSTRPTTSRVSFKRGATTSVPGDSNMDCRFNCMTVRAWPISSWSSRAMFLRSVSCASTSRRERTWSLRLYSLRFSSACLRTTRSLTSSMARWTAGTRRERRCLRT